MFEVFSIRPLFVPYGRQQKWTVMEACPSWTLAMESLGRTGRFNHNRRVPHDKEGEL
jgi:hypothetical protein